MEKRKTYGSCESPDAMYVKLISSNGHEFIVKKKKEHARTSGTIKAMCALWGIYFVPGEWSSLPRLFCCHV
uniref:SKP1 component POZ domain-containing protein n=1 Tax=Urocitellus parryii TaxID=9999 RepID=A0A8D2IB96_UROPR